MSTQKQGEGVSLEAQKDAIEAFASHRNLAVTKWFEEKQTAAKGGRPIFNQMLRQLKRGAATGVIIHKIDRAARNPRDWAMVSELPDIGVDVYIATESLDFSSRGGRLTADIQAVIAADYIRNLREETIKGLNGRLKQGLYPFRAPVGYLDTGKGNAKTPDPRKAPLIREMFDLYASGQYSLRSLRAEMNARGLRNHAGHPLSLTGIDTIINNPFYTGLIAIRRTGKTYKGVHQPIVPVALFNRVHEVKSGRNGKVATRRNHLYRGLFRCGLCEGPMTPELQKGRVYYRCQTRDCPTKTVREDILEARILERLTTLQIAPEQATRLREQWSKDRCGADQSERQNAIRLAISDDERRLARLTDLLIDGVVDQATYSLRKQELELALSERHETLNDLPDIERIEHERADFLEPMKSLASLHILGQPEEKREIVVNVFSNRRIVRNQIVLEPHDWLQPSETGVPVLLGAHFWYRSRTARLPKGDLPTPEKTLAAFMRVYRRQLGIGEELADEEP
ncbi:MAG: recombinase family protein [Rhizobiaceae bacterium]|nr:recombinase family protein [Rhizobiaceae bacterium]